MCVKETNTTTVVVVSHLFTSNLGVGSSATGLWSKFLLFEFELGDLLVRLMQRLLQRLQSLQSTACSSDWTLMSDWSPSSKRESLLRRNAEKDQIDPTWFKRPGGAVFKHNIQTYFQVVIIHDGKAFERIGFEGLQRSCKPNIYSKQPAGLVQSNTFVLCSFRLFSCIGPLPIPPILAH